MTDAMLAFLFADVEGCAQLWDRLPAALPAALQRYDGLLRGAIQEHGGRVFKMMGDACCAVFDAPGAAVAAALAGQRALLGAEWGEPGPLRARMALHAGPAERRDDDYFGPSLNRVARILAVGHGGQLLLSQSFQQQLGPELPPSASLRDLGERRLRGLAEPERLFQLQAPDLPAEFPPLLVPESNPAALPAASTLFVGRAAECAAVRELLLRPDARLVSLVGPGGIGKTRLSQQVALRMADDFPDGVQGVALASVSDPQLVPSAVAQALGVKEATGVGLEAALFEYLAGRRLLLVLDNLEQVLGAAPFVGRLLAAADGLRVLATSRELLGLPGERSFFVPPLALPDRAAPCSPEEAGRFDALRLFIERAQLAKSDWTLPPEQVPALIEICAQLDGLPLAIELAA
ncbi:MAG TPA: NB-ARC domain-containing protein, partial [Herpetosiphonaceae bacterium]